MRPEKIKQALVKKLPTTQEQRKTIIDKIQFFVIDRCDAPTSLTLYSLNRLSDKDLGWLEQAVANA